MKIDFDNGIYLFLAKTNSGKSYLMAYLLAGVKHKYDHIIAISPSEKDNHFWSKIIGDMYVFDEYDQETVKDIIDMVRNHKKRILLILDDCISDVVFHNDKVIKTLATRGRHMNLTVWLSSQYINGIPPVMRENVIIYFIGITSTYSHEILAKQIRYKLNKKQFQKLLDMAGVDRRFLIINTWSISRNLNEIYDFISAPADFVKQFDIIMNRKIG